METFKLNIHEISQFIKKQSVFISTNKILEVHKNKLVINNNGILHNVLTMDIYFEEFNLNNRFKIDYIQNLICEHLNLEPYNVIFMSNNKQEYLFDIKFNHEIIWNIIVCEEFTAINNMKSLYDEFEDISIKKTNIGPYKKLGNSAYYFRWYEKI